MARIQPLPYEKAEQHKEFQEIAEIMGFVSNSLLTMARKPELLRAFSDLNVQVFGPGRIEQPLKWLIGFVSSNAAGCRYCQAHTAEIGHERGVPNEKIAAAFEYETSPVFTDRERAALRLAHLASIIPNSTEDEHFIELCKYFDDEEMVEILSIIAMFGFLNRWNDTLGTELELRPKTFATSVLASRGWEIGKHGED